jgi:hypothetical protein
MQLERSYNAPFRIRFCPSSSLDYLEIFSSSHWHRLLPWNLKRRLSFNLIGTSLASKTIQFAASAQFSRTEHCFVRSNVKLKVRCSVFDFGAFTFWPHCPILKGLGTDRHYRLIAKVCQATKPTWTKFPVWDHIPRLPSMLLVVP